VAVLKPALEAKGCREGTSKIVARIHPKRTLDSSVLRDSSTHNKSRKERALELRLSARDSPIGAAGKP
jgi:hypothetical protein